MKKVFTFEEIFAQLKEAAASGFTGHSQAVQDRKGGCVLAEYYIKCRAAYTVTGTFNPGLRPAAAWIQKHIPYDYRNSSGPCSFKEVPEPLRKKLRDRALRLLNSIQHDNR